MSSFEAFRNTCDLQFLNDYPLSLQVHHDVESELQEAMSENVLGEESLLDGKNEFFLNLFKGITAFLFKNTKYHIGYTGTKF